MDITNEELVQNWETTGLIQNFKNKESIAQCLQAQLDINEKFDMTPLFKRWSIPVLIRVFSESKAFNRNYFVNYFEEGRLPLDLFLKTKFKSFEPNGTNIDFETKEVEKLANSLKEEIDTLFQDKKNTTIVFHGITHASDGQLILHYS